MAILEETDGSQEVAMSDPRYAEMVALGLLSQGRIPSTVNKMGTQGFVPGDTPNAPLSLPSWMQELSLWGHHPASPTGAGGTRVKGVDYSSATQPSRGSFSVMGGPQGPQTLGDLRKVGEVLKGLPANFQNLILQRITGINPTETSLENQMLLAKYRHQLGAPEREERMGLRQAEAENRMQNRDAQALLREQQQALTRERLAGTQLQWAQLMRQLLDSDQTDPGVKKIAANYLSKTAESLVLQDHGMAAQQPDLTGTGAPPPDWNAPPAPSRIRQQVAPETIRLRNGRTAVRVD